MKKLSLLLILLVCRIIVAAQENGYYVKNNNDTVRTYIYMNDHYEPVYRYYNAKHKARRRSLSADSVKAFRPSDSKTVFAVKLIEEDRKMQLHFVKLIDSGRINLYRYRVYSYGTFSGRKETYETWHVTKGSDSLKMIENDVGWPEKQTKYRNLFYSLISDNPDLAAEYMAKVGKHSLFYNPYNIEYFITKYNKAAVKSD